LHLYLTVRPGYFRRNSSSTAVDNSNGLPQDSFLSPAVVAPDSLIVTARTTTRELQPNILILPRPSQDNKSRNTWDSLSKSGLDSQSKSSSDSQSKSSSDSQSKSSSDSQSKSSLESQSKSSWDSPPKSNFERNSSDSSSAEVTETIINLKGSVKKYMEIVRNNNSKVNAVDDEIAVTTPSSTSSIRTIKADFAVSSTTLTSTSSTSSTTVSTATTTTTTSAAKLFTKKMPLVRTTTVTSSSSTTDSSAIRPTAKETATGASEITTTGAGALAETSSQRATTESATAKENGVGNAATGGAKVTSQLVGLLEEGHHPPPVSRVVKNIDEDAAAAGQQDNLLENDGESRSPESASSDGLLTSQPAKPLAGLKPADSPAGLVGPGPPELVTGPLAQTRPDLPELASVSGLVLGRPDLPRQREELKKDLLEAIKRKISKSKPGGEERGHQGGQTKRHVSTSSLKFFFMKVPPRFCMCFSRRDLEKTSARIHILVNIFLVSLQ
jgi:hypothetical protein